ncbi:MAG: ion channel protein AlgE [Hahellaceae bacterium]|nr:ion channel protein AlgE [Hahellaceae bacterium]MCP5169116.1 ion channel protein AlgE [Hahellaceae bacterium]
MMFKQNSATLALRRGGALAGYLGALILLSGGPETLLAAPAVAQESGYEFDQKLSLQAGYGPEGSLIGQSHEAFMGLRYEPTLRTYWPQREWSQWQTFVRLWLNYNTSDASNPAFENAGPQIEGFSAEAREFYLKRNLINDDPRLSATLGRQRFSDHFGVWWDDSIESLRVSFQDTDQTAFIALAEHFSTYNSDDIHLAEQDKKILYLLADYSQQWQQNHWAGLRGLYEYDHSDDAQMALPASVTGSQAQQTTFDTSGFRVGFYAHGDTQAPKGGTDYHVETLYLQQRRVSPQRSPDHREGWAVIGEVGQTWNTLALQPRVALRTGITDKPSDARDGFYLNRLQSDRVSNPSSYTTGLAGSFVTVDLRNLFFYGVILETHPDERQQLDIRLFDLYSRNDNLAPAINMTSPTLHPDHSIGQVLDISHYWKAFPWAVQGKQLNMNLLSNLSYFVAGDASQAAGDDIQVTMGLDLRY